MLLIIVVRPLTRGCQHVAPRVWKITGRAPSSCNVVSMPQTSSLRRCWSVSSATYSRDVGISKSLDPEKGRRSRNRWFADSPLEGDGFEPLVPRYQRFGFP